MLSDGLWHKCSSRKRIVAVRFMVQSANTYTDTYNQCVCAVVPTNYTEYDFVLRTVGRVQDGWEASEFTVSVIFCYVV